MQGGARPLGRRYGASSQAVPELLQTHPVTSARVAEARDRARQPLRRGQGEHDLTGPTGLEVTMRVRRAVLDHDLTARHFPGWVLAELSVDRAVARQLQDDPRVVRHGADPSAGRQGCRLASG